MEFFKLKIMGLHETKYALVGWTPFIFIGVIPAHVLLGKAMNGMGTVGVIALAGIVLRNSILLVDFARSHIADGMTVKDAILSACELRVRPIIITALAIILGESVLYFDPSMQGLGITMPSGTFISTLLTLGVVPIAFYQLKSWQQKNALKKAARFQNGMWSSHMMNGSKKGN